MNFSSYIRVIKYNWSASLHDPVFRRRILVTPVAISAFIFFFPWFFDYIESRNGTLLSDPLLQIIPAINVYVLIFICLYTGMTICILNLVVYPRRLLIALATYFLVTTARILSITYIPLLPPQGYIPLNEPIAQLFAHDGKIISKDLFFSGHVATIMSLIYPVKSKTIRAIALFFALMVALLVLVQHIHYTVDVLAAPVITYLCYLLAKRLTKNVKDNQPLSK